MQVVFVDNHLLIVVKPAGVSTQPHPGSGISLLEQAKAWVKKEFNKPGNVFLEPVHRLDKPVSGLVLFARTSKALSRLQEMMRNREIEKTYFAWVEGSMPEEEGTLEHSLVHDEHRARVVTSGGKLARLHYAVLKRQGSKTQLKITLETGRYHQIRAQLAAAGCPIVGDDKYGSAASFGKEGIALHAGGLAFCHPVTKKVLNFTHS